MTSLHVICGLAPQSKIQATPMHCTYQIPVFASLLCYAHQRWSPRGRLWPRGRPRGHFLKSLALASKVKSLALASRPPVLENWPVLGSRTALFFELLKFCGALEKFFGKRFFVEIAWKMFIKTFFFGEHLRLCPLFLASSIPVLGLESIFPRKGCPWPRIFFVSLASSLVSSTPPLTRTFRVVAYNIAKVQSIAYVVLLPV